MWALSKLIKASSCSEPVIGFARKDCRGGAAIIFPVRLLYDSEPEKTLKTDNFPTIRRIAVSPKRL